ncbi:MAG: C39 family peptidase [Patescibacteria group bacterium]|nr:C39 family peptidase [Patescibacteria group bacterium]
MFNTKNKTRSRTFLKNSILAVFVFTVLLVLHPFAHADDNNGKLESLEQKAQNYKQMINLKQQQQMSLQNQLGLMDIQIESFQNDIEMTKHEIEKNDLEIKEIQRDLDRKEKELNRTKNNLSEMIRLYYQIDQELGLEFVSGDKDLSIILNQSEYINQTSQKVDEFLNVLKVKKNELKQQQNKYKQKKEELIARKEDLSEKILYAGNEKLSKNILLEKTRGQEDRYHELLVRVEKQKQELIDLDSLSGETRQALNEILANAPKPSSGLASKKWYYAQDDDRWAYKRIGLSSSLMKDYGCAVTSLSMIFTHYNNKISPGKLSSQPIFYRDLIVWPKHWKSLKLNSSTAHGNIDWKKIKKEAKKEHPVIIFVRAHGGKGHYVVIHGRDKKGRYVVHDPLFGPNLYLETTKKLVGAIYNSSVTVDQMLIYKKR